MRSRASAAVTLAIMLVVVACSGGPSTTPVGIAAGAGLTIQTPADGSLVFTSTITVSGSAPAGARVVHDISPAPDVETTADTSGRWSMPVELGSGDNALTFRIGDDSASAVTIHVTHGIPTAATTPEPTVEPTATDELVPTEEPTAEPTPEPDPLAFSPITLRGTGHKIKKFKIPEDAAAIAVITERGSSNFIVESIAGDGTSNALLVNEIGNYRGTRLFDADVGEHSVAFDIQSNGSWTIVIKPIELATPWNPARSAKGTGSQVLRLTALPESLAVVTFTHRGSSNFVVTAHGDSSELLVNEIGHYSGQSILPDSTVLLEIEADGAWTITPS